MDELRALREARYEQTMARAAGNRAVAPRAPQAPRPVVTPVAAEGPAADFPTADPEVKLCGHRAISGRTCTREHGHAAKSHRYS